MSDTRNDRDRYLRFLERFVNIEKKLRVVMDCSNGPAGVLVPKLKLPKGTKFVLNAKLDGTFPAHGPDPLAQASLDAIRKEVLRRKADLGVVFDADGDRAVFVDETGKHVQSAAILILLSLFEQPPFVADVMVHQFAKTMHPNFKHFSLAVSRVGSYFVKQVMRKTRASIGAEYSGHYYFKDFFYADSACIAAIKVMNALSRLPYSMRDFVDFLPALYHEQFNVRVLDAGKTMAKIRMRFEKQARSVTTLDGLLFEFETSWFLVRPSNTEPLLRFFIGATTNAGKENLVAELRTR